MKYRQKAPRPCWTICIIIRLIWDSIYVINVGGYIGEGTLSEDVFYKSDTCLRFHDEKTG
ncbi:MAG: hypothetical protein PUK70_08245 [Bacteroidales bacterium]|nr:hypothetical protein [Bacteroidales bacterium]MDY6001772.1 hypothetical protein [Candidatus Cryptobacteroides sp.]